MQNSQTYDANQHGYRLIYRPSKVNVCPGCGHTNWYIGRATAECAFCDTVLPLQQTGGAGFLTEVAFPVAA